jgi:branched-chain amino acid transport system permease protein
MIESIIVTTVLRGALYALLASGLSLIYGVGRIINLAHTAFYMLAAFTMYYFMMQLKLPPVLTVVLTLVAATVVGLLVYRFLIDRIRQHEAAVLIVSVAVAMALQELMRIRFGSLPSAINDLISGTTVIAGVVVYKQQLLTVGVAALVIVALELLLSKTRLGIAVRAVAQDAEVANLMGISVPRTLMITVGIGTGLAGVAAVLMAPLEGAIYYMWMAPLMMVLVIIVLGGLGNIKGGIIGAFIIALVEALVYALLPTRSYLYTVFALAVMVIVLSLKPGGLFGIVFEEERL